MNKLDNANSLMKYFGERSWIFHHTNLVELKDAMDPSDQEVFEFDSVKYNDMDTVTEDLYMGARRYILKEDDSNINWAKKRYLM